MAVLSRASQQSALGGVCPIPWRRPSRVRAVIARAAAEIRATWRELGEYAVDEVVGLTLDTQALLHFLQGRWARR